MDEQYKSEIQKGFNAGYLLEKLNPKLAARLRSAVKDKASPFIIGFSKGAEQYNQESFFDAPPPNVPSKVENLERDIPGSELDHEIGEQGFEP